MWPFLSRNKKTIQTPLTPAETAELKQRMKFTEVWQCSCGSTLKIHSPIDRARGESQLKFQPKGHRLEGHAIRQPDTMSWSELAHERGWLVSPKVQCPPCRAGITRDSYKQFRRKIEVLRAQGKPDTDPEIQTLLRKIAPRT